MLLTRQIWNRLISTILAFQLFGLESPTTAISLKSAFNYTEFMINHLRSGGTISKRNNPTVINDKKTTHDSAEDRTFFKPYHFPFWGLPYGIGSAGGFFNPGLFPFVPGGPGFPPFDGIFGSPFGPGHFPGGGPTPFQGFGNATTEMSKAADSSMGSTTPASASADSKTTTNAPDPTPKSDSDTSGKRYPRTPGYSKRKKRRRKRPQMMMDCCTTTTMEPEHEEHDEEHYDHDQDHYYAYAPPPSERPNYPKYMPTDPPKPPPMKYEYHNPYKPRPSPQGPQTYSIPMTPYRKPPPRPPTDAPPKYPYKSRPTPQKMKSPSPTSQWYRSRAKPKPKPMQMQSYSHADMPAPHEEEESTTAAPSPDHHEYSYYHHEPDYNYYAMATTTTTPVPTSTPAPAPSQLIVNLTPCQFYMLARISSPECETTTTTSTTLKPSGSPDSNSTIRITLPYNYFMGPPTSTTPAPSAPPPMYYPPPAQYYSYQTPAPMMVAPPPLPYQYYNYATPPTSTTPPTPPFQYYPYHSSTVAPTTQAPPPVPKSHPQEHMSEIFYNALMSAYNKSSQYRHSEEPTTTTTPAPTTLAPPYPSQTVYYMHMNAPYPSPSAQPTQGTTEKLTQPPSQQIFMIYATPPTTATTTIPATPPVTPTQSTTTPSPHPIYVMYMPEKTSSTLAPAPVETTSKREVIYEQYKHPAYPLHFEYPTPRRYEYPENPSDFEYPYPYEYPQPPPDYGYNPGWPQKHHSEYYTTPSPKPESAMKPSTSTAKPKPKYRKGSPPKYNRKPPRLYQYQTTAASAEDTESTTEDSQYHYSMSIAPPTYESHAYEYEKHMENPESEPKIPDPMNHYSATPPPSNYQYPTAPPTYQHPTPPPPTYQYPTPAPPFYQYPTPSPPKYEQATPSPVNNYVSPHPMYHYSVIPPTFEYAVPWHIQGYQKPPPMSQYPVIPPTYGYSGMPMPRPMPTTYHQNYPSPPLLSTERPSPPPHYVFTLPPPSQQSGAYPANVPPPETIYVRPTPRSSTTMAPSHYYHLDDSTTKSPTNFSTPEGSTTPKVPAMSDLTMNFSTTEVPTKLPVMAPMPNAPMEMTPPKTASVANPSKSAVPPSYYISFGVGTSTVVPTDAAYFETMDSMMGPTPKTTSSTTSPSSTSYKPTAIVYPEPSPSIPPNYYPGAMYSADYWTSREANPSSSPPSDSDSFTSSESKSYLRKSLRSRNVRQRSSSSFSSGNQEDEPQIQSPSQSMNIHLAPNSNVYLTKGVNVVTEPGLMKESPNDAGTNEAVMSFAETTREKMTDSTSYSYSDWRPATSSTSPHSPHYGPVVSVSVETSTSRTWSSKRGQSLYSRNINGWSSGIQTEKPANAHQYRIH